ncbi:winged helix-turn-helix transcriptional regulator [Leucobacter coleopterorum]|uniref:Winged helix-turn-helix transcriptional regulator n=1 Tax=Leucobacter coleopterorum TaxID=2714933 RepID=A0ABX6JWB4_9MICO|nr:metalloregulator ArsR/SmtB family transcription factor [Leucobacter coleopterorum]QIM18596.1 winged helix-turn-helix transcriptional regulator [Leucobacter coleopterorum]
MTERPSLSEVGAALAEPTRLRILQELLEGTPLPAGALAARLGLSPSTVSSHVARLLDARLVSVLSRGRTRLVTIATPEVAEVVEGLLRLSAQPAVTSLTKHTQRAALREARTCYDHLAGRLGIAIADLAREREWVIERDGSLQLIALDHLEAGLGIALHLAAGKRPEVRGCMDWTERRPHLAGKLGAGLLTAMLQVGWLQRRSGDRSLKVTTLGKEHFATLGIDC